MPINHSAGSLLYRIAANGLEVLLVHPSGNYNRHAPWSIPKGIPEPGETLAETARRETQEETGITPGELMSIGSVDYSKSRKRVHCFAGSLPPEAQPGCASWEVDRAELVPLTKARELIHPDQRELIDRLEKTLKQSKGDG